MFVYEKKLQYPVKIKNTNPKLAAIIISQYGGPDGELGASLRYLSQRYSMPYPELKGLLTDIGTEELGHLEMIGTIVHQLTRDLTEDQIKTGGFDTYFVDRTAGEIGFNVQVEMSRNFLEANTFIKEDTVQIMTDPLVINLDTNVASVTDQKFLFDLDADGTMDQISFEGEGSGFLALDRNGDGTINDGTELFGTQSGRTLCISRQLGIAICT